MLTAYGEMMGLLVSAVPRGMPFPKELSCHCVHLMLNELGCDYPWVEVE